MASVDVAVPSYQYGRFLRDCVASVLNQNIQDLRVRIIDNASTDNSLEVAHQLAAEDCRVQVVAHPRNLGHIASFNEGIDWASSDYFMVLCADDLLAPGCLSRAISIMERCPAVNLTFGRELAIGTSGPIPTIEKPAQQERWQVMPGGELLERLCRTGRPDPSHFMIAGGTAVVRASAQKRVGHYRDELPHTADLEMWLRFARLGAAAETDCVQGIRRLHPHTMSASLSDVHMWDLHWEAAFEYFFAHEGHSVPEARRLLRIARRALSDRAYWGSIANLLRGDTRLSLNLLRFALARHPSAMVVPPVGYLFQRGYAFNHIAHVISDAARRLRMRPSEANHIL
jgi:glycosyltransferase involved in cell wall biosynthesis